MVKDLGIEKSVGTMTTPQPAKKGGGDAGDNFESQLKEAQQNLQHKKEPADPLFLPVAPFSFMSTWDTHFTENLNPPSTDLPSQQTEKNMESQLEQPPLDHQQKMKDLSDNYMAYVKAKPQVVSEDLILKSLTPGAIPQFLIVLPSNVQIDVGQLASRIADQIKAMKIKPEAFHITVSPRELGNINLTIKMVDGKVNISISVDSGQEQFFKNNLDSLLKDLQKQNITVGELSVSINNSFHQNSRDRQRQHQFNELPSDIDQVSVVGFNNTFMDKLTQIRHLI